MGLFQPSRRAQPRRFSYEPRYYNPEKDEGLKRRMRVHGMGRVQRRRSKANLIYLLILLGFAIYIFQALGKF